MPTDSFLLKPVFHSFHVSTTEQEKKHSNQSRSPLISCQLPTAIEQAMNGVNREVKDSARLLCLSNPTLNPAAAASESDFGEQFALQLFTHFKE